MNTEGAFPSPFSIEPSGSQTTSIILLHGRGSNGPDFAEELLESGARSGLSLPEEFPGYKWIFPTSENRYSDVFKEDMTQWFDVDSLTDPERHSDSQIDGLRSSMKYIMKLIEGESRHLPPVKIVLGGISQGCAVGIMAVLSRSVNLKAFVGFCGWLPLQSRLETIANECVKADPQSRSDCQTALLKDFFSCIFAVGSPDQTPSENKFLFTTSRPKVFLSHCADDGVMDIQLGRDCRRTMEKLMFDVQWQEYEEGGHWINEAKGVDDFVSFLKRMEER